MDTKRLIILEVSKNLFTSVTVYRMEVRAKTQIGKNTWAREFSIGCKNELEAERVRDGMLRLADTYGFDPMPKHVTVREYGLEDGFTTYKVDASVVDIPPIYDEVLRLEAVCPFCGEAAVISYGKKDPDTGFVPTREEAGMYCTHLRNIEESGADFAGRISELLEMAA